MAEQDLNSIENPLTEAHYNEIQHALNTASAVRRAIDKAKQAHIDVGNIEEQLNQSVEKLKAIKRVYFPGR